MYTEWPNKTYTHFDVQNITLQSLLLYLYKSKIDMRDVLGFWIQLHCHPDIEISFKFVPKILMSKECMHFIGPLCIVGPQVLLKTT